MKYIKSILIMIYTLLFPLTALANQTVPEKPLKKIAWSIDNCGPMPTPMLVGLVLLAAMIVITILIALMKGDDSR